MGEAAVRVAKTANYFNAGTVEFLLDKDKRYYFLEVNTRIQVEHPITEEVCGVDLVAAQMIVASGGELPWKQSDIKQRGSAIECRIYAEDAAAGFLPAAGPALFVKPPQGPGIRFDGGVETGDEVSVYYDPIVAKLVAYAQDRATAIQRMLNALQDTVVLGFTTNIEFLRAVLKQSEFIDGNLHIGFLAQYMPDWTQETLSTETMLSVLTLSSLASDHQSIQDNNGKPGIPEPWQLLGRWELSTGASR